MSYFIRVFLAFVFVTAFGTGSAFASRFQIEGDVFYNDQRDTGYFDDRFDTAGLPGTVATPAAGVPDYNYLGARGMTVRAYEIDDSSSENCARDPEMIAEDLVNRSGHFTLDIDHVDKCGDGFQVVIIVSAYLCNTELDQINDRCIGIYNDDEVLYEIEHPLATSDIPLRFSTGLTDIGAMNFEMVSPSVPTDDFAKAANYFAALFDATEHVHQQNGVPFRFDEFGMVKLYYPRVTSSNCTGGASVITCSAKNTWTKGTIIFHEYGHVLNARVWGGNLGQCSVCPGGAENRNGLGSWSPGSLEYPKLALTEGFANFVSRAVQETCVTGFDANTQRAVYPPGVVPTVEGEAYIGNVTKLFCDLRDFIDDNDTTLPGFGDSINMSLTKIMQLLEDAYVTANPAQLSVGLTVCDILHFYAYDGYFTPPAVIFDPAKYLAAQEIAHQNGLACGLPAPPGF